MRGKLAWFAALALCLTLAAPVWAGWSGPHACCRLPHAPGQAGLQAPCCCPAHGSCCLAAPAPASPAGVLRSAPEPAPALAAAQAARPAATLAGPQTPAARGQALPPDPGPLFLRHSSLLI